MARLIVRALAAILLCASFVAAQQISGTITGVVRDSQQGAVVNAKVVLTNVEQGTTREANSGADGSFVFTLVQPGTYNVVIESPGFKKVDQKDVKLFANDRISLGDIVLSVGALSETVSVEAQSTAIQTQSAERAGVLTGSQVLDFGAGSRSLFDLVRVMPGVVYTGGLGGIAANGNRSNQNNFTLDGVTNVDTGSNGGTLATTNMDMIAEMKVITNSQTAEFGRSSGAQIEVVTKSGTKQFHGTGYLFHKHEDLNANSWRNNIDNRQRAKNRVNTDGFNIGGPAYIPGVFNKNKDKFFFFVGIEWQNQLSANGLSNVTVPTALERTGNYSLTHDGSGFAPNITIFDPLNGKTPFAGNIIPAGRISSDGQKILNFYPQPNAAGIDPSFNYQTQVSDKYPRRERIFRGDYNISDKWKAYVRYIDNQDEIAKAYGQWNASYNIPFGPMSFGAPGWSFVSNVTTIINPTLTNEFVFGSSRNDLHIIPLDKAFDRAALGLSYKMPYPSADTLQLVQNWNYGGVPNAPTTNFAGTPFSNFNHTTDITDSMAKVWGAHTLKGGIYLHKSAKDQTAFTSVNGNINFARDTNNPGDSNWAFSNALLGNYDTLQQSNQVLNGMYRSWNVEWYVQDNWHVNSKLTLEYGLRFYWVQPQFDAGLNTSSWNKSLYDPANAAVLRIAGKDAGGNRVAVNPLTGETGPAALIGSIVNNGKGFVNGLYANGIGLAGKNGYPKGLIDDRGLQYAPRVGMAYQFMPKTVLRVGGGVFYDRLQGNPIFDMLPNPPSTAIPQFYYGTLATIPSAASGAFFPQSIVGFDKTGQIPTTYNWNLTLQRELPGHVLFDVGYVGMSSNHNLYRYNQNAIGLGAAWLPQNQNPENASPKFDGTTSNQPNFYRPFSGYGGTTAYGFGANSNYHALQASANRRFGKDLTGGFAYTWSKNMGTTNDDGTVNHPFNMRKADYSVLGNDRTHVLVVNYVYSTPKLIRANGIAAGIGKVFTNDWQVSGITTFQSGSPTNIGYSIANTGNLNERFTGSPDIGARVLYTAPVTYPGSQYQWLTASLAPPTRGSQGFDSARYTVRNPGFQNWDLSILKNIPLKLEGVRLQLRAEMFKH